MTSFFQREMSNCTWKCHQCDNISCCSTEHWAGTEQKEELVPLKRVCLVRSCEQRETSVLWAKEKLPGCWSELSLEELDCRFWDSCCNKTIALTSVPLLGAIYLFKCTPFSRNHRDYFLPWWVPVSAEAASLLPIKRERTCKKFTSFWLGGVLWLCLTE